MPPAIPAGGCRRAASFSRRTRQTSQPRSARTPARISSSTHRTRDPFHGPGFETESVVSFDTHDLFVTTTRDALGNVTAAEHDYRTLQPRLLTDANGNRSQVAFDATGQVVGTAVMGKSDEDAGDSLDGFVADLDEAAIVAALADPARTRMSSSARRRPGSSTISSPTAAR